MVEVDELLVGLVVQVNPALLFVKGHVIYVSDFPDTPAELMRNFENEVLVKALTNDGPITEVHVEMEKDARTTSGYRWSSPKGPNLLLSSGTMCTAEVITRWQKPITPGLSSIFARRRNGIRLTAGYTSR